MSLSISCFCGQSMLLNFLVCLLLISTPYYVRATYYYPDGVTVAAGDFPCTPDGDSACCGDGFVCLSNNICMATGNEVLKAGQSLYVRGSCTDRTWKSRNCPSFCINPNPPNQNVISGGNGIARCPYSTKYMFYCIFSMTSRTRRSCLECGQ